jgi:hypothetical protein
MTTNMTEPKTVDRTIVGGKYLVSTIALSGAELWPGIYEEAGGAYETMVFPCDEQGIVSDWTELACQRYRTRGEAMTGHMNMVQHWTDKN